MLRAYVRFRTDEQARAVKTVLGDFPDRRPEVFVLCPLKTDKGLLKSIKNIAAGVFADLPFIARESECGELAEDIRNASWADGLVIKNVDEMGIVKSLGYKDILIADSFLYAYNSEAMAFYKEQFPLIRFMAPDELTDAELLLLPGSSDMIIKAYGRARVMLTAQSISDNYREPGCNVQITSLKHDRFISSDEEYGYSVVYTDKPVSLPDVFEDGRWENVMADLTLEGFDESVRIITAFLKGEALPSGENGHHYKGID